MTVVYKKIPEYQKTNDEVLIISDLNTHRLLYHKKVSKSNSQLIKLPLEIFTVHPETVIHHDMMDPQIVVCSSSALNLFVDNYDYTNLDIFIQGVLENEELLNSRIYMLQLSPNQYARKISNWQAYHFVSQDILGRWVYPLLPTDNKSLLNHQVGM